MSLSGNWNYPTAIRFGAGRISELPASCRELGISRPLLVTDPGLAALPMVGSVISTCCDEGLAAAVFSDIKGNPTSANVADGVKASREGSHDGIIAFGGGSGLDAAKAVALMAGQSCSLWDLEDVSDNWLNANAEAVLPIMAVPTTAGTGSEVGRASVITDEDNHVKKIIFHPKMLPEIVIADPELTIGLPPKITAATGMDALSHNLEAFCAPGYHPMARGIAVEGIRLVKEYLPIVVSDGSNVEARAHMLVASSMGATAFQRGLGAMHALAHPLGALYDAHHGLLNAIVMPYVLVANRKEIETELDYLARCIGLANTDELLEWVLGLRRSIGIPHTLDEIEIDTDKADQVGEMATADPSADTNPIRFTKHQYSKLFHDAVAGNL